MKLEMIQDDIDLSMPQEADRCPIAMMLNRYFPLKENYLFYVYESGIEIGRRESTWNTKTVCMIKTPAPAKKFIKQIDGWDEREKELREAEYQGRPGIRVNEIYDPDLDLGYRLVEKRIRHLKKPAPIVLELDINMDCLKEALA